MRRIAPLAVALVLLAAAPAAAAPTIEEFALPTAGATPQDLVLGPDGNIWFTERGISKIGRISASSPGTIDEFPTKDAGSGPDIIIVGPDGNLWYTERPATASGVSLPRLRMPRSPSVESESKTPGASP